MAKPGQTLKSKDSIWYHRNINLVVHTSLYCAQIYNVESKIWLFKDSWRGYTGNDWKEQGKGHGVPNDYINVQVCDAVYWTSKNQINGKFS